MTIFIWKWQHVLGVLVLYRDKSVMLICPGCCFFAISLILWVPFGNVFDDSGFCFSPAFSWPVCSEKSGKSVNVASQFTEGHKVKKLNNWNCILNMQKLFSLKEQSMEHDISPPRLLAAPRTALNVPEPLTRVGLKLRPIKLLTVKWTLLTFILKHSTKFNDCAYDQSSKASPCQQPSSLPVSKLFVNPQYQPIEGPNLFLQ